MNPPPFCVSNLELLVFEGTVIKRNNEVDRLAKVATGLPLLEYTPTHPGGITVNGGSAPTTAKKRMIEKRHYELFSQTHWLLWHPPDDLGKMAVGK